MLLIIGYRESRCLLPNLDSYVRNCIPDCMSALVESLGTLPSPNYVGVGVARPSWESYGYCGVGNIKLEYV